MNKLFITTTLLMTLGINSLTAAAAADSSAPAILSLQCRTADDHNADNRCSFRSIEHKNQRLSAEL